MNLFLVILIGGPHDVVCRCVHVVIEIVVGVVLDGTQLVGVILVPVLRQGRIIMYSSDFCPDGVQLRVIKDMYELCVLGA